MSESSIVAIVMLLVGSLLFFSSIISLFKQKVYLDASGNPIMTEIDIPIFGKVKTNLAALGLAVLGAFVVWWAGYLVKTGVEHSQPKLITFNGEITIDEASAAEIPTITVRGSTPRPPN